MIPSAELLVQFKTSYLFVFLLLLPPLGRLSTKSFLLSEVLLLLLSNHFSFFLIPCLNL